MPGRVRLTSYLMSDFSAFVNGEVVTIDGGEWLKGAGEFNFLQDCMKDSDWESMKPKPKKAGVTPSS